MSEKQTSSPYVVLLAHSDGRSALNANKMLTYLRRTYPDLGVHLIVSQATKNKEGQIVTRLQDLKPMRTLKEINLQAYFHEIDAMQTGNYEPQFLTFNKLAERHCVDKTVHFTSRGGPAGGEEAANIIDEIEKTHGGNGPLVLLSVDTMAILPERVHNKYRCFSTHPGALDTHQVRGMQGTLRQLVYGIFFDEREGRLPRIPYEWEAIDMQPGEVAPGYGKAFVQGTLFLQDPELDKGPSVILTQTELKPDMCAYQVRNGVYGDLTDIMIPLLPTFLDPLAQALFSRNMANKKRWRDSVIKERLIVPELDKETFELWQGCTIVMPDGSEKQNQIVDPEYFKRSMRAFFPGSDADFETSFNRHFGATLARIEEQRAARKRDDLRCSWAEYLQGGPKALALRRKQAFLEAEAETEAKAAPPTDQRPSQRSGGISP